MTDWYKEFTRKQKELLKANAEINRLKQLLKERTKEQPKMVTTKTVDHAQLFSKKE